MPIGWPYFTRSTPSRSGWDGCTLRRPASSRPASRRTVPRASDEAARRGRRRVRRQHVARLALRQRLQGPAGEIFRSLGAGHRRAGGPGHGLHGHSGRRRGFCGLHPVRRHGRGGQRHRAGPAGRFGVSRARSGPPDLRAGAATVGSRRVLVFGHGHPLTSGLDTVDYFVLVRVVRAGPDLAEPRRFRSTRINAEAAVFFDDDSMVLGAASDADDAARKAAGLAPDYGATGATLRLDAARARGDGAQKYEEQLVCSSTRPSASTSRQHRPTQRVLTSICRKTPRSSALLQHSRSCIPILTRPSQCPRKGARGVHFVVGGRADAPAAL